MIGSVIFITIKVNFKATIKIKCNTHVNNDEHLHSIHIRIHQLKIQQMENVEFELFYSAAAFK